MESPCSARTSGGACSRGEIRRGLRHGVRLRREKRARLAKKVCPWRGYNLHRQECLCYQRRPASESGSYNADESGKGRTPL